ncbi:hypothetical protein HA385_23340 [Escherichia coli]|nr:hypothetical protein [Escherichia coli]
MDFSISYASRQLNSAEKNYTTTEREGLGMVYAVKKFRHYLLANKFVFFTNHPRHCRHQEDHKTKGNANMRSKLPKPPTV